MQDDAPSNKNSDSFLKKYGLRIVIILAIGIPVILELNTLYNLVKVHVFGREEPAESRVSRTLDGNRGVAAGDTLYSTSARTVTIRDMRVSVSPTRWNFILVLAADSEPGPAFHARIDSVWLDSGERLPGDGSTEWQPAGDSMRWERTHTWEISNGDIPRRLSMVFLHRANGDTVKRSRNVFRLGSVPVRYRE